MSAGVDSRRFEVDSTESLFREDGAWSREVAADERTVMSLQAELLRLMRENGELSREVLQQTERHDERMKRVEQQNFEIQARQALMRRERLKAEYKNQKMRSVIGGIVVALALGAIGTGIFYGIVGTS